MPEETTFIPSMEEPEEFSRNPLVRFKGTLESYEAVQGVSERTNRDYQTVRFHFADLEVLECTEPFPFDTTTISVPYSTRPKTAWDAWRGSAVEFIPTKNIDDLIGKRQEWYYGPIQVRRPNDDGKWVIQDGRGWTVVAVEGANAEEATANVYEAVITLVAGKTDEQFYEALFSDSKIKKMAGFTEIVDDAMSRKLLTKLEGMKQIVKHPDGKWAKV